jgi:class 3 adenylate cyclase
MPPAAAHLADLAIVMSDIDGVTRLMTQMGDLAVHNLVRSFHNRASGLAAQHHGRLIKEFGDCFIAVFDRAADALRFARELPSVFCQDEIVDGERLSLKLAIHFGQVSIGETPYGEDVFGYNVNVVARLDGLARPKEILISEAAMQQLSADQLADVNRHETTELKGAGPVGFGRLQLAGA